MRIASLSILLYAVGIVLLSHALVVAISFTCGAFFLLGCAKVYEVFLPRYHAHIIWKITEAEARLEELNREQIS